MREYSCTKLCSFFKEHNCAKVCCFVLYLFDIHYIDGSANFNGVFSVCDSCELCYVTLLTIENHTLNLMLYYFAKYQLNVAELSSLTKYFVLNNREKMWCKNVLGLHRYRDFRVGVFYSDSPCKCWLYTLTVDHWTDCTLLLSCLAHRSYIGKCDLVLHAYYC